MRPYSTEIWEHGDLTDDGTPDGRACWDDALPLAWYTPVFKFAKANLSGEIVWFYPPAPDPSHLFGEPRALTERAAQILTRLNEMGESFWKEGAGNVS